MTLYLKMGGRPAIERAVRHLERRLLADERLTTDLGVAPDRFAPSDFAEFLIYLFGGAPFYEGPSVRTLFRPYCRCDATFDMFVDHLATVLIAQRLPVRLETELRLTMETIRPRVLSVDELDQSALSATAQNCA